MQNEEAVGAAWKAYRWGPIETHTAATKSEDAHAFTDSDS